MFQILGIALATLLCSVIIKSKAPQFAVIISVAGTCIILGTIVAEIKNLLSQISDITSAVSSSSAYIVLMMKVLIISILTQLLSDICRDNGENAIASMTEIAAKLIIISLVLPLFKTILTIVLGLIK